MNSLSHTLRKTCQSQNLAGRSFPNQNDQMNINDNKFQRDTVEKYGNINHHPSPDNVKEFGIVQNPSENSFMDSINSMRLSDFFNQNVKKITSEGSWEITSQSSFLLNNPQPKILKRLFEISNEDLNCSFKNKKYETLNNQRATDRDHKEMIISDVEKDNTPDFFIDIGESEILGPKQSKEMMEEIPTQTMNNFNNGSPNQIMNVMETRMKIPKMRLPELPQTSFGGRNSNKISLETSSVNFPFSNRILSTVETKFIKSYNTDLGLLSQGKIDGQFLVSKLALKRAILDMVQRFDEKKMKIEEESVDCLKSTSWFQRRMGQSKFES